MPSRCRMLQCTDGHWKHAFHRKKKKKKKKTQNTILGHFIATIPPHNCTQIPTAVPDFLKKDIYSNIHKRPLLPPKAKLPCCIWAPDSRHFLKLQNKKLKGDLKKYQNTSEKQEQNKIPEETYEKEPDSQPRIYGFGYTALDSQLWTHGFGHSVSDSRNRLMTLYRWWWLVVTTLMIKSWQLPGRPLCIMPGGLMRRLILLPQYFIH